MTATGGGGGGAGATATGAGRGAAACTVGAGAGGALAWAVGAGAGRTSAAGFGAGVGGGAGRAAGAAGASARFAVDVAVVRRSSATRPAVATTARSPAPAKYHVRVAGPRRDAGASRRSAEGRALNGGRTIGTPLARSPDPLPARPTQAWNFAATVWSPATEP
jgi:hypothetical protein